MIQVGADAAQERLVRAYHYRATEAAEKHVGSRSPGVTVAIESAADFAKVDSRRKEFVLDHRSVVLGLLDAAFDHSEIHRDPTLAWIGEWLGPRLPTKTAIGATLRKHRMSLTSLQEGWSAAFEMVLSLSARRILQRTAQYAKETVGPSPADVRHLLLSLLTDEARPFAATELGWALDRSEREQLLRDLLSHIATATREGENQDAWWPIVNQIRPLPTFPSGDEVVPDMRARHVPRPTYLLSGFAADRTWPKDADPLSTRADVLAMARLICHEEADLPISIGIFGGWGSGKSTFMERLQVEVDNLSGPAAPEPADGGPRFVAPVVQIRFNAWQFADANLWASLTAEFFDQLRAGGFQHRPERVHSKLIEDVNEHVRGLSKDAAERRAALSEADEKLKNAKAEHDKALQEKQSSVHQALVSALADSYQRNRGQFARLGLLSNAQENELERFIGLANQANSQAGQAKLILQVVGANRLLFGTLLALLVIIGAIGWRYRAELAALLAAGTLFLATVAPTIAWLLSKTKGVIDELSPLAVKLRDAQSAAVAKVLEKELELRTAEDEAAALREASERADRALARYVDPSAGSNPPRVLRYLLEDDPDTKAFEKEIGLMGRARRLFEALDEVVAKRRAERGQAAGGERVPARIVLYIDDLDRCTHEQVYKVLQALHLLLAFRLFVVIVAVDVAWVEAALAKFMEFGSAHDTTVESSEQRRVRAIEYLSKIFQLAFWLRPLTGGDDSRFGAYVRSLTGAGVDSTAAENGDPPEPEPEEVSPEAPGESAPDEALAEPEPELVAEDEMAQRTVSVEAALATMLLDKREVEFLTSPAIAAVASSDPRGVKRLVNVYKIVRARLSEVDDTMILGGEGRTAMYPFVAVLSAVETGQPPAVADALYNTLKAPPVSVSTVSELISHGFWNEVLETGAERAVTPSPVNTVLQAAAEEAGGNEVNIEELLLLARIVRRYSFNKYH